MRCERGATQAVKRSEQEWKRAGGCMLHKTKRRKIKAPGVGPGAPEMVEKVEVVVETVGVEGGLTDADMAAALAAKGGEVAGEIARSPPPSSLPQAPPPESKKRAAAAMSQSPAHTDAARASKRERKVLDPPLPTYLLPRRERKVCERTREGGTDRNCPFGRAWHVDGTTPQAVVRWTCIPFYCARPSSIESLFT